MSDQIYVNDLEFADRIAARAGTHFNEICDHCVARARDEVLLGGVVYQNYTGESIAIHSASWDDHWINRAMLYATFDYPFNQLGVKRLFGIVPADNGHALAFNKKAGFEEITRIPGVYKDGTAAVVMKLESADCRFLGVKPRAFAWNRS